MTCSVSKNGFVTAVLSVLGVAYPFVVYLSLGRVPTSVLIIFALVLVGTRLGVISAGKVARQLCPPLIAVALVIAALGLLHPDWAAKAYPVLMSAAFGMAFGLSLIRPPTLVEIFAETRAPNPSSAARGYMRKVTWIWFIFLSANALTSLAVTAWGSAGWWTFYNGFLSYVLMGLLFTVEWLIRRRVRARSSGKMQA